MGLRSSQQPLNFAGSQGAKATVSGVLACGRIVGALHSVQAEAMDLPGNARGVGSTHSSGAYATVGAEGIALGVKLMFLAIMIALVGPKNAVGTAYENNTLSPHTAGYTMCQRHRISRIAVCHY
jgi:hypothetical protein